MGLASQFLVAGDLSPCLHGYLALLVEVDLAVSCWDASRREGARHHLDDIGSRRRVQPILLTGYGWPDAREGLRAGLTVACDGRDSAVRVAAGLVPRSFAAPMDVWWFRLPQHSDDPLGGVERMSPGQFMVMIDRGDYWQCAYLIGKGTDTEMRAEGIQAFRRRLATFVPWLADRVEELRSFDDVKLLDVQVQRIRRRRARPAKRNTGGRMTEQQPWQWDEPTWRGHVERVRTGCPLRPKSWPGGAKVAVALSFDSDHETPALRDGEVLPGKLSQGEYGARAGVPRILKLLQRFGVPSTFFMPAVSALLHDDGVKSHVDGGHEVALHGWIHERNTQLPAGAERDLAFRAAETLESLAGTFPVGIRTPSWDFSACSLRIIRELGLTYDSSLMADDDCYEILAGGESTGLVEVPVEWIRDDLAYFAMDRFTSLRPYATPRGVLSLWRDEFDVAYAEGGDFQLTLRPHCIGHRSRITILTELLEHIVSHEGVWFATHAQIAHHVLNGKDLSR